MYSDGSFSLLFTFPFLSFSRSASMYGKQNCGDSYPESVDSVGVTEQPIVFFQVVALGSLVSFGHFPQFYRFVCNEIKSFFRYEDLFTAES